MLRHVLVTTIPDAKIHFSRTLKFMVGKSTLHRPIASAPLELLQGRIHVSTCLMTSDTSLLQTTYRQPRKVWNGLESCTRSQ